jgi:hypothetical protein
MTMMKTLLAFVLAGAIFGTAAATLIAPGFLTWYSSPGSGQAMCSCSELVRDTAERLIRIQVIGAITGSLAFLIVGILVVRGRRPAAPPPTVPSGGPPP